MPPKVKRVKKAFVPPMAPSLQQQSTVPPMAPSLQQQSTVPPIHQSVVPPIQQSPVLPVAPPLLRSVIPPLEPLVPPVGPPLVAPPLQSPLQQPHVPNQRPRAGRQSSRVWTVQVTDEQGNKKEIKLIKIGVFDMPRGERIVVPFDRQFQAFGEAATLLSGACKRIATDSRNIPINFDVWPNVPTHYKDSCLTILKTSELKARRYCYLTMSRKYKDGKTKMWNNVYDTSLSREQLIANVPDGVHKDQWSSFVDYHLKEEYKKLCQRNVEVRKMQTIPHTGGAKLLSTKQNEMEVELGRAIGRGELYIATHKKKDGSYVNEDARTIGEKVTQEMSQSVNSTKISVNDGKVLGNDHAGRVRCLGLGGLHSVAFESGAGCSFSSYESAESSQLKAEVVSLRNQLVTSDENFKTLKNVMLSYIQMKEGHIPSELGAMLGSTNNVVDEGSEQNAPTVRRGESSLNSNVH